MSQRTLHYRKKQHEWAGSEGWHKSLEVLGTCAYAGTIPPAAITRVVSWPHRPNMRLMLVWDPTITIINQRICGDRYRALTAKLLAGDFTGLDTITPEQHMASRMDPAMVILPAISEWKLIEGGGAL